MRVSRRHGVRGLGAGSTEIRRFSLGLAACWLMLCVPLVRSEAATKHVLVLHSYHEGLAWTDGQNAGIKETLGPRDDIELAIEYLDSKRIPYENISAPFADYLEQKWERNAFDAIVVTDNSALDFMAAHHARLFPNTPISFCGINEFSPAMVAPFQGRATGVVQALDPAANIDLILTLQPRLQRLVVVSGTTPTARNIFNEVRAAVEKRPPPFSPVWLDGLDTATLKEELAKLSANDAVLLCNFNRDANGVYYSHEEGAELITRASAAPVYAMGDQYMGTGVVGGFISASYDQGRVAAEQCLAMLATGAVPDIDQTCPSSYMFDYAALARFGFSVDALPAESIILNEPTSFYHDHKRLIWKTGMLFVLLLIALAAASIGLFYHRRAEARVRESQENLRVTLYSIGDAVISTDTQSKVRGMNPVAERLTGWDENDAVGRPLVEVFHIINAKTREPQKNPVEEALDGGEVVALSNHTILISKSGAEYQVADSSAPIRDTQGRIRGVVMVFRDVTEEYALQEQLHQSQKMDAIGQLAGGVAHDLNNMLGGILGGAELLKISLQPEGDDAECIGIIEDSVRRAAGLTGRLLAFARRQPVASTPVDVHDVLKDTIALLGQTIDKRVKVECELEAEASTVVGDNAQLQSVFMNLGINAAQAMPDGGSLVFSTRVTDISESQHAAGGSALKAGAYLQVKVRDTGRGILPEHMDKIFDPFFTTKAPGKGTGMGLAASHGTVVQHGGAITAYSEPGEGAVFHLLFPLTDEAAMAMPVGHEPIRGEGTILLVDDEPVMRASAAALLKEYGYHVLLAENGREAVNVVERRGSEIDLVVLDMVMPEMNGRDCFFHLRAARPDLPVVLSSGFSRAEDLEDMKKAGLADFIQKPFRGAELSQVVAKALKR